MIKTFHQKGFTLLELLVVLLIVAMAASLTGPQLWKSYTKASERSTLQTFAGELQQLRSQAFHSGRMIELPATRAAIKTSVGLFPVIPEGWELERSSVLRLLPTGVTNGAELYFLSPGNRRWLLNLRPLDGRVEIKPL